MMRSATAGACGKAGWLLAGVAAASPGNWVLIGASGAAIPDSTCSACGTRGGLAVNRVSPLRLSMRSIRYGVIL
ncbi:hypothetical protein D9M71_721450 [compost metagenome]